MQSFMVGYFFQNKARDTCTLLGTMVQSVHVTYDKWGLTPPYPLNCFQIMYPPYQTFQERIKKQTDPKNLVKISCAW